MMSTAVRNRDVTLATPHLRRNGLTTEFRGYPHIDSRGSHAVASDGAEMATESVTTGQPPIPDRHRARGTSEILTGETGLAGPPLIFQARLAQLTPVPLWLAEGKRHGSHSPNLPALGLICILLGRVSHLAPLIFGQWRPVFNNREQRIARIVMNYALSHSPCRQP